MSQLVLIVGESGHGKSRSLIDCNPEHTFVFNTIGKDLPFPGSRGKYNLTKKNMYVPDRTKPRQIGQSMLTFMDQVNNKRPQVNLMVLEDYQYVMALEYVEGERAGEGWEKYTGILIKSVDVFLKATTLRDDLTVVIFAHTEESGDIIKGTKIQMKTVGKAFRQYFTPEGVPTIVLMADPIEDSTTGETIYRFRTQTNGRDVIKSPEGMFPKYIENSMEIVRKRISEYYEKGTSIEESEVLKGAKPVVTTGESVFG